MSPTYSNSLRRLIASLIVRIFAVLPTGMSTSRCVMPIAILPDTIDATICCGVLMPKARSKLISRSSVADIASRCPSCTMQPPTSFTTRAVSSSPNSTSARTSIASAAPEHDVTPRVIVLGMHKP